jgi:fluoroquinolone resistance protein
MIENKVFEKIDYTAGKLPKEEYENCTFLNCIFYNSDLSSLSFYECEFFACDFSLSKLNNTLLNDIQFKNCKLLGLRFDTCNDSGFSTYFENCQLKLSTFFKLKLIKTKFINCNLQEVDFSETDLSGSLFENCDLQRAVFDGTNLEKVDFSSSFNFSIDPEKNRIKKARFSNQGLSGLLDKYNIEIV